VVATTTILGSVVSDILVCAVGDDASLTVLMPIGADPHDFQASSEQVAVMSVADLVVSNGLYLEEGIVSILESLEADGAGVVELAERLDPLPFAAKSADDHDDHDDHGHSDDHDDHDDHGHSDDESVEEEEEHAHGDFDPHFWLDMGRMALASELIGAELAATMDDETLAECGVTVAEEIRAAEAGVVATLASIPSERRVLVTDHDSFAYFADSYDFRVVGVVVPGGSTLADPSSKDLATLVATIRSENVPALFANTATSSAVAEAIAAESGEGIDVVALFVGSLGGPGSGAENYITMMQSNAALIAKALTD
jgi:zinc/manganese transport system substrate-binding protein